MGWGCYGNPLENVAMIANWFEKASSISNPLQRTSLCFPASTCTYIACRSESTETFIQRTKVTELFKVTGSYLCW